MELFLAALSGVAWTIVYIASIRIGFKHCDADRRIEPQYPVGMDLCDP